MYSSVVILGKTYEIHLTNEFEVSLVVPENRRLKYEHETLDKARFTANTIRDVRAFVRDVQTKAL